MRFLAALLIIALAPGCTHVPPGHREALKQMQPISTPLFELLMQSEIPHQTQDNQGSASDLSSSKE
jgi:hypothetical protein